MDECLRPFCDDDVVYRVRFVCACRPARVQDACAAHVYDMIVEGCTHLQRDHSDDGSAVITITLHGQ